MIKELITKQDVKQLNIKYDKFGRITADESKILMTCKWSEFQIQSGARNLFMSAGFGDNAIFVQIDNGGSAVQGIRKKKAATGTVAGFSDVIIIAFQPIGIFDEPKTKNFYIEFKKIGGVISEKQKYWHDFLKEKGESVYFCNNLLFFEKIILKEIKDFLMI